MDKPRAENNFFEELLVVLVIYKMEINESLAFNSLTNALRSANQKASIFIYDNSASTQRHTPNDNWVITYRNDPSNPGVSKAYNQGFELAKSQNKKWLLLVDQDTVFQVDVFDQFQNSLKMFHCAIVVPQLVDQHGLVSPLKFYLGGGQRMNKVRTNHLLNLKDFFFHNSGLLVSVDEFELAGKYDENLPLDFSDFSFVARLRKGNQFFVVANIKATHHLAATSSANFNERLVRFQSYLIAGNYFKKYYRNSDWLLSLRILLRSIKLTFQYRNIQFLVSYFR